MEPDLLFKTRKCVLYKYDDFLTGVDDNNSFSSKEYIPNVQAIDTDLRYDRDIDKNEINDLKMMEILQIIR